MARYTAFSREVQLFADQIGEERRQALIALAKESFAEADRLNTEGLGHTVDYETFVDGRKGADPESVRRGGTISYTWQVGQASLADAVDEAFRILTEMAPYAPKRADANPPTHYNAAFRLFVNGTEQNAVAGGAPIELKETDEIQITNLQPYARRIEKGWSTHAPNGIFEVVAMRLRARFGNILTIQFMYQRFPGFEVGTGRRGAKLNRHSFEGRSDWRRAAQYPTILMRTK